MPTPAQEPLRMKRTRAPPVGAKPALARARQRSELALLAQLHHPNLVVLFDAGEDSGRAYLVMEFVDGPTLSEQLRSGPMQAGEVSRLGAELAYALAYVHSRGITHRDVKPANVLMGGRPMLTDFGIARLVDAARVTQTGYLIGTPAYLAPEQVSGGPVGMPADVYALGLVLLEALSDAAAEITTRLNDTSVEVRLRGREADLVVNQTVTDDTPTERPATPGAEVLDGGDLIRITLRMPEALKSHVEQLAGELNVSVNAWLVRAVMSAVNQPSRPSTPPGGRGRPGKRITGFFEA